MPMVCLLNEMTNSIMQEVPGLENFKEKDGLKQARDGSGKGCYVSSCVSIHRTKRLIQRLIPHSFKKTLCCKDSLAEYSACSILE